MSVANNSFFCKLCTRQTKKLIFSIRCLFVCCPFELDWVSSGLSSVNRTITTKLSMSVLLPFIMLILLLKDTAGKLNMSTQLSLLDFMHGGQITPYFWREF